MSMKIMFTGGHLTTALAIIDEIQDQSTDQHTIVFVGRKHANEHEQALSLECKEIQSRQIKFIDLPATRLSRVLSQEFFIRLLKLPDTYIRSYKILSKEKPDCIFTCGSYIGLPIAIVGWLMGIPVYMHEQTIHPGLANQLIGQFATHIFVAFKEARDYFDRKKTTISGNPLRTHIFHVIKQPFHIKKDHPVIYVTGGSLGSHSINQHIERIIHKLLKSAIVIHQTGNVEEYHDYERLQKIRSGLPVHLRERYFIRTHFQTDEIGYVYHLADLVVGRSGANTFFELIALQKPAVFIPLPWSSYQEQQQHAQLFVDAGTGELFDQAYSSKQLLQMIRSVLDNIETYKENFTKLELRYKRNVIQVILKKTITD